eukprot:7070291-Prymnesium_polylepis.1
MAHCWTCARPLLATRSSSSIAHSSSSRSGAGSVGPCCSSVSPTRVAAWLRFSAIGSKNAPSPLVCIRILLEYRVRVDTGDVPS